MISLIHYISFFCFVTHGHHRTPVNVNPAFTYSEFLCHSSFVSSLPVPIAVSFSFWNLSTNTELTERCFRDIWYRQSMTVTSSFNFSPKSACGYFSYCWWNGPLENWFTEYENHKRKATGLPSLLCWRPCALRLVWQMKSVHCWITLLAWCRGKPLEL